MSIGLYFFKSNCLHTQFVFVKKYLYAFFLADLHQYNQ